MRSVLYMVYVLIFEQFDKYHRRGEHKPGYMRNDHYGDPRSY